MGGPSAAAAYTATSNADRRQRLDAAVHSLRKSTAYSADATSKDEFPSGRADRSNASSGGNNEQDADGLLSDDFGDDEDEDDEYDDFDENEMRAAAELEREEMKRHFNFPLEKRRSLKNQLMSAMHKKRRLLMRSENLRFRELYKAPEPGVLLIAASIVTIVTLILTKSWPFY